MTAVPDGLLEPLTFLAGITEGLSPASADDCLGGLALTVPDPLTLRTATLLRVALAVDAASVLMALDRVTEANRALTEHETTSGHALCCGGSCPCADGGRRCPDCHDRPVQALDGACSWLLGVLTVLLRPAPVSALVAMAVAA